MEIFVKQHWKHNVTILYGKKTEYLLHHICKKKDKAKQQKKMWNRHFNLQPHHKMNELDTTAMGCIKLAEFMEMATAGWFTIFEAHFCRWKIINTETKFYDVLSAIQLELVMNIQVSILTKTTRNLMLGELDNLSWWIDSIYGHGHGPKQHKL